MALLFFLGDVFRDYPVWFVAESVRTAFTSRPNADAAHMHYIAACLA
ncbi:hypothetical protein CSIRO_2737 [Bradyrhizobiaceae bacterium SG-6C]|nr:hypothetical protein CSIRO_2737 [Bradyrhizobiaceae bacterium SG-6C]